MSINGAKGRARFFKQVRARQKAEAAAAGIDPNDRAAVRAHAAAATREALDGIITRMKDRTP